MVEIRVVVPDDLARIEVTYPISVGTPGNPHREQFQRQREGQLTWLVAWNGDQPCGSVILRWPGEPDERTDQATSLGCAEIGGLGVDEAVRGRGIGAALMQEAETLARSRHTRLLGLEVTDANPNQVPARSLYNRLGYEDAGFGTFISGYTYWDTDGTAHRDEEPHRYLIKWL
ncbi:MAG: GNAT family N-acetyltransferase [Gemmatimonadetes bacterium]|nr:GNAT family N-acetyltransferase [Gemmatimonadota bacterium]